MGRESRGRSVGSLCCCRWMFKTQVKHYFNFVTKWLADLIIISELDFFLKLVQPVIHDFKISSRALTEFTDLLGLKLWCPSPLVVRRVR